MPDPRNAISTLLFEDQCHPALSMFTLFLCCAAYCYVKRHRWMHQGMDLTKLVSTYSAKLRSRGTYPQVSRKKRVRATGEESNVGESVATMRRPVYNALVAGIWAVAGLTTAAADRTQAFSPERQNCHRPFPSFFWAGAQAGEHREVMVIPYVTYQGGSHFH